MSMLNDSILDFSAALASKAAVPGGGGASALAGALGIALGSMVGALTVGKKKYADVEEDIKALMVRAEELRLRILYCVDKDAEAFEPLSKAYGIPKDDPTRDEVMEKCLRVAAAAPVEILELSCQAIEILEEFAAKGSVLAISDAATGAALCRAALYGAAINAKVNTAAMKDKEYTKKVNAYVDEMVEKYGQAADRVYSAVVGRFC